ncbi:flagellar basal body-associated FliL family protein [Novosphingobium pituita]|jgi:flagellar FliL protein|uniref:Flagellar protein FliL n=1 Tax=Novosphingobium pituita TaxID=3056842 RepID=A0ABQ6PCD8_9SPHN|nr:flagellar basal body-associated FliL family protein [Novosphingobium sp. IK01]GMM61751.1 flagellar basal body-associated FliL family protein [Novosphingobium sp. IK01]HIQ16803.1 flagellar basal body-associated FliL family protein [Novosphingobium capsulatum]
MSEKKDKDKDGAPKKKKGGPVVLIGVAVGTLAIGGGAVYGLFAAGILGGPQVVIHEDNKPKLIRKGEEDPYAPPAKEGEGEGGGGGKEVDGEGGSEYRTVYYSFAEDFTSNLRDSDRLVQMSVAVSTRRDYRVILWIQKHELAIRSAMLAVLADTPDTDVETIQGKQRLQQRLTAAINKVLTDTEGFGGVDAVYFKQFIVQ